jgi:hypothetical protein
MTYILRNQYTTMKQYKYQLCIYIHITQSVNNATNCSFFISLSTQHVSALNGHLQVPYYTKTDTLH